MRRKSCQKKTYNENEVNKASNKAKGVIMPRGRRGGKALLWIKRQGERSGKDNSCGEDHGAIAKDAHKSG
jgi:hypothetical protein